MGNNIIAHVLCLMYVPGLIFHELCHIVALFLMGGKIISIQYTFPTKDEIAYGVNIDYSELDPLGELIVSSAPVIGLVLMLIILPIINMWIGCFFFLYVLFRGKIFFMSLSDKAIFNNALNKIRNVKTKNKNEYN